MLDSCVIHFPFDLIEKVLPISNLPLELEIFSNGPL
uniref:Ribosomal protein S16 n=1 Tax=Fragaria chiloensis TaxID=101007 RepID=A0A0H3W1Z9_9ROSA|nr:ribosomal protein S16 [Fragaria chiloensis]